MNILVGDDDSLFAGSVVGFLETCIVGDAGEVRFECSADGLVKAATSWQPDIVLSDYDYGFHNGGFKNGLEAVLAIKEYVDSDANNGWAPRLIVWSGVWRRDVPDAGIEHFVKEVDYLRDLV